MSNAYTRNTKPSYTPPEPESFGVSWTEIPVKKVAAVILWLVGVACTKEVTGLFMSAASAWLVAIIGQGILTLLESALWRRVAWDEINKEYFKRSISGVGVCAFVIDLAFNIPGVWLGVQKLHEFPLAKTLGEMFDSQAGGQSTAIKGWAALVVCAIIGTVICAGPEKLWYDED